MLKPIKNADGNVEIRDVFRNSPPFNDIEHSEVLRVLSMSEAIDLFNELNHVISEGKG